MMSMIQKFELPSYCQRYLPNGLKNPDYREGSEISYVDFGVRSLIVSEPFVEQFVFPKIPISILSSRFIEASQVVDADLSVGILEDWFMINIKPIPSNLYYASIDGVPSVSAVELESVKLSEYSVQVETFRTKLEAYRRDKVASTKEFESRKKSLSFRPWHKISPVVSVETDCQKEASVEEVVVAPASVSHLRVFESDSRDYVSAQVSVMRACGVVACAKVFCVDCKQQMTSYNSSRNQMSRRGHGRCNACLGMKDKSKIVSDIVVSKHNESLRCIDDFRRLEIIVKWYESLFMHDSTAVSLAEEYYFLKSSLLVVCVGDGHNYPQIDALFHPKISIVDFDIFEKARRYQFKCACQRLGVSFCDLPEDSSLMDCANALYNCVDSWGYTKIAKWFRDINYKIQSEGKAQCETNYSKLFKHIEFEPLQILDFGCGSGVGAKQLMDRFPLAVVDLYDVVDILSESSGLVMSGPLAGGYDLIVVNNVIHHAASLTEVMDKIYCQSKQGTIVLIRDHFPSDENLILICLLHLVYDKGKFEDLYFRSPEILENELFSRGFKFESFDLGDDFGNVIYRCVRK